MKIYGKTFIIKDLCNPHSNDILQKTNTTQRLPPSNDNLQKKKTNQGETNSMSHSNTETHLSYLVQPNLHGKRQRLPSLKVLWMNIFSYLGLNVRQTIEFRSFCKLFSEALKPPIQEYRRVWGAYFKNQYYQSIYCKQHKQCFHKMVNDNDYFNVNRGLDGSFNFSNQTQSLPLKGRWKKPLQGEDIKPTIKCECFDIISNIISNIIIAQALWQKHSRATTKFKYNQDGVHYEQVPMKEIPE